jgi:ABC-type polysaccharide transport system permease subunit
MASSDNEFIIFLEENKDYTALLNTFKVTLLSLFIGLIYSIVAFVVTDYKIKIVCPCQEQPRIYFLSFEFIFIYGMIATALSIKDTIIYSQYRAKFIFAKYQKKENTGGEPPKP